MTDNIKSGQMKRGQIERHLQAAVNTLAPDILERIDLTTPQDVVVPLSRYAGLKRRLHVLETAAAACFCAVSLMGGVYVYQNRQVESVISLDVNPSIELSVNRKDKILNARALNPDAVEILDEMELKGVDLDIAVNAVIGSMVKHGYLQDLDNAILVTVNNDSISKARSLRSALVEDIHQSLKENQVEAVVYDQQAVETDEVKQLADRYGISYGKAYFLQELIALAPGLSMDDMERLSTMTMEEIAKEIAGQENALTPSQPQYPPVRPSSPSEAETQPETTETEPEISKIETAPETTASTEPETTIPETTASEVRKEGLVQIDYTDYDNGILIVNFKKKLKWNNPTVSVTDSSGNTYWALVDDTDSTSCQIRINDLAEGEVYTFVLGGMFPAGSSKQTTVSGTFETPIVSVNATQEETPDGEEEEETETPGMPPETSVPESSEEIETSLPEGPHIQESGETPSSEPQTESGNIQ